MIDQIIAAMKRGDRAAAWIAIEFIEEDGGFAFGSILKSNCARELRRFPLDDEQKRRIRARVVGMLERGFLPHEFQQYEKLLRRVGVAEVRARIEACLAHESPWARWRAARLLGDFATARPRSSVSGK